MPSRCCRSRARSRPSSSRRRVDARRARPAGAVDAAGRASRTRRGRRRQGGLSCGIPTEGKVAVVTARGAAWARHRRADGLGGRGGGRERPGRLDRWQRRAGVGGRRGRGRDQAAGGSRWRITTADRFRGRGAHHRHAVKEFGSIDVLVNNAGILRDRMIFNMAEEDWDAVIAVHLKGTFNCTRHAACRCASRSPAASSRCRPPRARSAIGTGELRRGQGRHRRHGPASSRASSGSTASPSTPSARRVHAHDPDGGRLGTAGAPEGGIQTPVAQSAFTLTHTGPRTSRRGSPGSRRRRPRRDARCSSSWRARRAHERAGPRPDHLPRRALDARGDRHGLLAYVRRGSREPGAAKEAS